LEDWCLRIKLPMIPTGLRDMLNTAISYWWNRRNIQFRKSENHSQFPNNGCN
jgi:hypothetical protein